MKISAFAICLLALYTGCTEPETPLLHRLQTWDRVVDESPEAIRDSLQTLRPYRLNRSEQAYCALLNAAIAYKLRTPLESDSALQRAAIHYESRNKHNLLARAQFYIGQFHYTRQHFETAFDFLKKAEFHAKQDDSESLRTLAQVCFWLGQTHARQSNFDEALGYTAQSAEIYKEVRDTAQLAAVLNALCYLHIGQEQFPQAGLLLDSCRRLLEAGIGRTPKLLNTYASILNGYTLFFQHQNRLDSALHYSQKCIAVLEQNDLPTPFPYHLSRLFLLYNLGLYDECLAGGSQLLESAKKEKNDFHSVGIYRYLFLAAEKRGLFEQACRYRETYSQLKDELNTQREGDALRELEKKYELSEQERELLRRKNQLWALAALSLGVVLFLSLISLITLRRKREWRKKHDRLADQVLRTQWGYILSRKVIANNFNAFEEVEKLIARNSRHVTDQFLHEFKQAARQQKREYSNELYDVIQEVDTPFTETLKELYPTLPPEQAVLAFLTRDKWDLKAIAGILDISFEAARKRQYRLRTVLMGEAEKKGDLAVFLQNLTNSIDMSSAKTPV